MSLPAAAVPSADDFAARMLDMLNGGALSLMVSIGHRLGLFDTLAKLPPATSAEIAAEAGLAERYVREWLAALVAGRIVSYHPGTATYYLPPAHAASLSRAAGADNLATMAQIVPLFGAVEADILRCFRDGGGLTYDAYGSRLHEVIAEDSEQAVVAALHDAILPLVPGLAAQLRQGIDVLDVGCGAGGALIELATTYPASRFFGYELNCDALDLARGEIARRRLGNITVMRQDAASLPDRDAYDLVTAFDAIACQADPSTVLSNIHRALRRRGVFLMQDIAGASRLEGNLDHPLAPLLYAMSTLHATPVSLGRGGPGLGAMWGRERALAMLADAGFDKVEVRHIPHDLANTYYVAPKLTAAND